jgi:hypothetical protein
LLPPSVHSGTPVEHEIVPLLQALLGLVMHVSPAVQSMHAPSLLQTLPTPQLAPADFAVPLVQTIAPVAQLVTPFVQGSELLEQVCPAMQSPHMPFALQTMPLPQLVPGALLVVVSTQVIAPVVQAVVPSLHLFGFVAQVVPAVHGTQVPLPLQTILVPQEVPAVLLPPSTQVIAPVVHDVMPVRQTPGLPVHELPAVQATHVPLPLQTMFVPQEVPAVLLVPSMQTIAPVEQDVVPFLQLFGLVVQL